ncbi:hypothetical protein ROHU_014555 [Labeo rohita]|uniref:Uncharacterized protein n=1 Tax=Labeo rohita TaxID=84645 RepID=A0A498NS39_LABRO|nr:hypothetical protein ROHU_014555 [Labeo rohita]
MRKATLTEMAGFPQTQQCSLVTQDGAKTLKTTRTQPWISSNISASRWPDTLHIRMKGRRETASHGERHGDRAEECLYGSGLGEPKVQFRLHKRALASSLRDPDLHNRARAGDRDREKETLLQRAGAADGWSVTDGDILLASRQVNRATESNAHR